MSHARIGFIEGFILPSRSEKIRALGRDHAQISQRKEFESDSELWSDVPAPSHIDDWLAQYEEEPQSYRQWKSLNQRIIKKRANANTIYLLQFGSPGVQIPHFPDLCEYLKLTYMGLEVKILPPVNILCPNTRKPLDLVATYCPGKDEDTLEWDLDTRVAHEYDLHRKRKAERQIRVDPVISILSYIVPSDAFCLCAVTMEDLYDGDEDSFVSGMAAGRSHVGVFSFARYTVDSMKDITPTECEGLQLHPKSVRSTRGKRAAMIKDKILLRRSCKTLSHEIGHLFGIGHCVYYNCIMNGSGHLLEDFAQSMHFCPVDLRKIETILHAECLWKRYIGLREFYNRHKWYGDATWVAKRLNKSDVEILTENSAAEDLMVIEID